MSLHVWPVPAVQRVKTAQTMITACVLSLSYHTELVEMPVEDGQFVLRYRDWLCALFLFYPTILLKRPDVDRQRCSRTEW